MDPPPKTEKQDNERKQVSIGGGKNEHINKAKQIHHGQIIGVAAERSTVNVFSWNQWNSEGCTEAGAGADGMTDGVRCLVWPVWGKNVRNVRVDGDGGKKEPKRIKRS